MVACISRDVSSTMINLTFGDKKKKKNTFSKNEKLLNGTRRNFNLSILRHSWKIHKIGNLKKNHFTSTASNTSTYSFVTGRMPQSVAKNVCHVPFLASLRSIESRLFQRDKLAQRGGGRDRQWREENEWIVIWIASEFKKIELIKRSYSSYSIFQMLILGLISLESSRNN